jgi:hypothetical protein
VLVEHRHGARLHGTALGQRLGDDFTEHVGAAEPLLGIAMTRARDDFVDLRVDALHDVARSRPAALEWFPDEDLVEQRTDAVDVGRSVDRAAREQLWCDAALRRNQSGDHRGRGAGSKREVDHAHATLAIDDDTLVAQRAVMSFAECRRDARDQVTRGARAETRVTGEPLLREHVANVRPVDVFRGDPEDVAGEAGRERSHQVLVLGQLRRSAGSRNNVIADFRYRRDARVDDVHGGRTLRSFCFVRVCNSHRPERLAESVLPELKPRLKSRCLTAGRRPRRRQRSAPMTCPLG